MKFKCPICGGPLGYERSDDGLYIAKIIEDDKGDLDLFEIHNKSNGYDLIYCIDHKLSHIIPYDLRERLLKLINRKLYSN
jgi:hypothetical protein